MTWHPVTEFAIEMLLLKPWLPVVQLIGHLSSPDQQMASVCCVSRLEYGVPRSVASRARGAERWHHMFTNGRHDRERITMNWPMTADDDFNAEETGKPCPVPFYLAACGTCLAEEDVEDVTGVTNSALCHVMLVQRRDVLTITMHPWGLDWQRLVMQ